MEFFPPRGGEKIFHKAKFAHIGGDTDKNFIPLMRLDLGPAFIAQWAMKQKIVFF